MLKKHYISLSLFFLVMSASLTYAQNVVQLVPFNGQPSTEIVAQIIADTTANNGIPANRIYELTGGGLYICQQQFYVEAGQTLRMRSSNNQKPIIYLYPSGTGSTPGNPPGHFIRLRGGNLEMTGLAVSGYFEPVDSNFNNVQGTIFRVDAEGSNVYLKNSIFSNINGQILRTEASTKTIRVEDCIFTNLGALSTSNFGAGKGIDLRAVAVDSLILVNNTWTNYQDRVVRHYNFSNPTAGTGNIKYTLIDHNTMYNGMGFHGLLSLGNVGEKVIITNNLFKDAFASGEDSTDGTRTAEWANTGEKYPNGNNRMTWIFTAPNDTTMWTVKNNFFAVSDSGQAFFNEHTNWPLVVGKPLSWHINSRLGADSVTAFTLINDPVLTNTQALMSKLMRWYVSPTGGNKTKNTPSTLWVRAEHDMDRRPIAFWINDLNCAYQTTSPAYTGSMGGFPAGDLNWFPTKKAEWQTWLTGISSDESVIPSEFSMDQNYPNPFNPATKISFNLTKAGYTTLAVYNLLGEKVATIVNQELQAGRHTVDFDASRLSSGVYIYKIESGNNVATMKMTLLK